MKTKDQITKEKNEILRVIQGSNRPLSMTEIREITGIEVISLRLTELHHTGLIMKTHDGNTNLFAKVDIKK